jgi:hypothetical protein
MTNPEDLQISHTVFFDSERKVADTASIFRFQLSQSRELLREPGQYVWLVLKQLSSPDPRGERRAFSIISSVSESDFVGFGARIVLNYLHALKKGRGHPRSVRHLCGPNAANVALCRGVAVAPFFQS